jgi:glutaredoxin-like YruB-family protein
LGRGRILLGLVAGIAMVLLYRDGRLVLPYSAADMAAVAEFGATQGASEEREAPRVVVYTTPWCGWCRKTLAHLDDKGIRYVNKDIEANAAYRQELRGKTGSTAVPVIEIGEELVRGFDVARIDHLLSDRR